MTLSRNNELGLYTPRSLWGAGLRPWGSLPRLVAALSSALVKRLEDQMTRIGAGRGLSFWISFSVALLSGSGFKLKSSFYRCARGCLFSFEQFLAFWISFCLGLTSVAFPSRAPRERDCAKRMRAERALTLQLVLASRGDPSDGSTSSAGFSETRRLATQLEAGTD